MKAILRTLCGCEKTMMVEYERDEIRIFMSPNFNILPKIKTILEETNGKLILKEIQIIEKPKERRFRLYERDGDVLIYHEVWDE